MREYVLSRFSDIVELNAFVAESPDWARLEYKTSRLAGLWQLDLENERKRWTVGYYIDGFGDRSIEYSIAMKRVWCGYVDEELEEKFNDHLPHVLWPMDGRIFVALPHKFKKDTVISAPQVCGRTVPMWEPVYIWRDVVGYFNVLDCGTGLEVFRTREEFENWIKARIDEYSWLSWYVIPDIVNSDEEWHEAIGRAVRGRPNPTLDDVLEFVRKLL